MHFEIERKFVVDASRWTPSGPGVHITQAYLQGNGPGRIRKAGAQAWITFKGPPEDSAGRVRREEEFSIPPALADLLLAHCCRTPFIEKTRHLERHAGANWEVDVFHGENKGLVLAEIELTRADESVTVPPWAIREVTGDPRFSNYGLNRHPWARLQQEIAAESPPSATGTKQ